MRPPPVFIIKPGSHLGRMFEREMQTRNLGASSKISADRHNPDGSSHSLQAVSSITFELLSIPLSASGSRATDDL